MANYTYTQLRNYVQDAIVDILENGQTVEWNGQKYDKANVMDLIKVEREFAALESASSFASSRKRYSGRVRY